MTLEEMLALLPDNDTGAIDAADLRTIVEDLWSDNYALTARVQVLEASSSDSVGISGYWQFNSQVGGVPGGAQVTSDVGNMGNATWLRFSRFDSNNVDLTSALAMAIDIYSQAQADSSVWVQHTVTGEASVIGNYVEVPVTRHNGNGTPGEAAWQAIVVILRVPVPTAEVQ